MTRRTRIAWLVATTMVFVAGGIHLVSLNTLPWEASWIRKATSLRITDARFLDERPWSGARLCRFLDGLRIDHGKRMDLRSVLESIACEITIDGERYEAAMERCKFAGQSFKVFTGGKTLELFGPVVIGDGLSAARTVAAGSTLRVRADSPDGIAWLELRDTDRNRLWRHAYDPSVGKRRFEYYEIPVEDWWRGTLIVEMKTLASRHHAHSVRIVAAP